MVLNVSSSSRLQGDGHGPTFGGCKAHLQVRVCSRVPPALAAQAALLGLHLAFRGGGQGVVLAHQLEHQFLLAHAGLASNGRLARILAA